MGAGSAGCLLANRLSANPDHRVLPIEAGGDDDWFWIKVPVGYPVYDRQPQNRLVLHHRGGPGLGRPQHPLRAGPGHRWQFVHQRHDPHARSGQRHQLWAQATGDERWRWGGPDLPGETLAIYKRVGGLLRRGRRLARHRWRDPRRTAQGRWKILDAWQTAAVEMGITAIEEFNCGDNAGSAYFHVNQRRGDAGRWPTPSCTPVEHRPNLTVYTGNPGVPASDRRPGRRPSACRRLDHRAAPRHRVQLLKDERIVDVTARREVILSGSDRIAPFDAGLGSGPGRPAAEHRVPVVVDLPGVGENLQDHLQLVGLPDSGCPDGKHLYRNWITRAGMGLQYLRCVRVP